MEFYWLWPFKNLHRWAGHIFCIMVYLVPSNTTKIDQINMRFSSIFCGVEIEIMANCHLGRFPTFKNYGNFWYPFHFFFFFFFFFIFLIRKNMITRRPKENDNFSDQSVGLEADKTISFYVIYDVFSSVVHWCLSSFRLSIFNQIWRNLFICFFVSFNYFYHF